jgi:hypothetical protein
MNKQYGLVLAVGAALVLVLSAWPQQPKRDPQATFEPRSGPGAGQKFLARFVGDWDVDKSFFRSNGSAVKTKGVCRQTMVQEGRFLQSKFTFDNPGGKSTGTGVIGFDPTSGKFTSVWYDSRRTAMSLRQSKEPFNGKEIVLYNASLDDEDRNTRRTKTVSHLEDDGRKLIHRQYALTPDGKERLMMELVLTKKTDK